MREQCIVAIKLGAFLGLIGPLCGGLIFGISFLLVMIVGYFLDLSGLSRIADAAGFIFIAPIIAVLAFFVPGFLLGGLIGFLSKSRNVYIFAFTNSFIPLVMGLIIAFVYRYNDVQEARLAGYDPSMIDNAAYPIIFLISFSTLLLTKPLYKIKYGH